MKDPAEPGPATGKTAKVADPLPDMMDGATQQTTFGQTADPAARIAEAQARERFKPEAEETPPQMRAAGRRASRRDIEGLLAHHSPVIGDEVQAPAVRDRTPLAALPPRSRRTTRRRAAVALPARNEAAHLPRCLHALGRATLRADTDLHVVIVANNCEDGTASVARRLALEPRLSVEVIETELPPARAHAGWARRLALDAAASNLRSGDLLLSTDADTLVAEDWLARTLAHVEAGYEAVAGLARLSPADLRSLPKAHRARLASLRRYDLAVSFLKAARNSEEPWPRHFYEGGASVAMTKTAYDGIGGAPTPCVGEDKALFDAVRGIGGKVRHAVDVNVVTSARLVGRAVGGASDTLAVWGRIAPDEPIPGVQTIARTLDLKGSGDGMLTFRDLPAETERARALVRLVRQTQDLADVG